MKKKFIDESSLDECNVSNLYSVIGAINNGLKWKLSEQYIRKLLKYHDLAIILINKENVNT